MKKYIITVCCLFVLATSSCKKDFDINVDKTFVEQGRSGGDLGFGGVILNLSPDGKAGILYGGDVFYSGSYQRKGNKIIMKEGNKLNEFKIISESAIAAGIRRIEAVCGFEALKFIQQEMNELEDIRQIFKGNPSPAKAIQQLQEEGKAQKKLLENFQQLQVVHLREQLILGADKKENYSLIIQDVTLNDASLLKELAFQIDNTLEKVILVLTATIQEKPQILVSISKSICNDKELNAGNIVRKMYVFQDKSFW